MKTTLALYISLLLLAPLPSFSQNPPTQQGQQGSKNALAGPRKHMATIMFAGLGGAVLGLSTLSFYGRPQDKLNNIPIGFAIGVFAGTCFVTYKAINSPAEFYGENTFDRPKHDLLSEHKSRNEDFVVQNISVPSWTFEF